MHMLLSLSTSFITLTSLVLGAPTVDLGYAQYQGTFNATTNITHFLGMRYAAAPVGDLRFLAPQAPGQLYGLQMAVSQPPRCLQGVTGGASSPLFSPISKRAGADTEDCLFLNVYTPGTLHGEKSYPVVIWIHGGGYVAGSATGFSGTDIQNGDDFITESGREVVVVVIQYRLGLFGFLSGRQVKKGGTLNAGLLDQQFAFQWVQEHISKFSGDPQKVTIWGESAGAGSVLQHIVANNGRTQPPLFRAAITSSSFLPSQYNYDDIIPELLYSVTVSNASCSGAQDTLRCLRNTDVSILQGINANISADGFFGTYVYVPVVDGTFITERPTVVLRNRKVNGDFLYSVTNALEGGIFVDASTAATVQVQDWLLNVFPTLMPSQAQEAGTLYAGIGAPIDQVIAMMGEAIFICPTYYLLRAYPLSQAYKGEFAIPPGNHGQDVSYYFPSMNANDEPAYNNSAFLTAFTSSFFKVARFLDPNHKFNSSDITPLWNVWNGKQAEMLFNKTEAGLPVVREITTSTALLQRCSFWESIGETIGQ